MKELYEDLWAALPAELDTPLRAEREAFLRRHLEAGDRWLDLGCGEGDFGAVAADAGARVVAADVAERALARARGRHPDLRLELVAPHGPLPWDDGAFDVVWASEVLEHVADTARWLSEVRRVLAPAGRLLVTTPDHRLLRRLRLAVHGFESHFDPLGDHLRFYTRRSLGSLLEGFGFGDLEIERTAGTLLAGARR